MLSSISKSSQCFYLNITVTVPVAALVATERLAVGEELEAHKKLVDLGNLGALGRLVAGVGGGGGFLLVAGLVTAKRLIGGEGLVRDRAAVSEGGWRLHHYWYWRRSGAAAVGELDETECQIKHDILSRFIELGEESDSRLTEKTLRNIVLNFVIAGRDTTATTLSWFLYMMIKNPQAANKVRKELEELEEEKMKEKNKEASTCSATTVTDAGHSSNRASGGHGCCLASMTRRCARYSSSNLGRLECFPFFFHETTSSSSRLGIGLGQTQVLDSRDLGPSPGEI
ncbi:Cytochrome P450 704B1 [Nymphaea thermarum]|nr:Cytochrome P450 704B1 [Nymphaea thermarum]